jgi:DNA mismatch repair protein MutL
VPRIRQLDDRLVSKIAAGEVVERPASVVKELVENALDAGATRLEIELESGGARRIRVADDGAGMDRDDSLLAFDRHATSKIASFEDLEKVGTLGFRGEALASIAGVAKVELLTAPAPGDGTRVRIEGGRVLAVEPAPRSKGTTIEIRSLFFNVPARRKFLKTRETELRRCLEVVEGYALARPEVAFSVSHEGRLLLDAPALQASAASARERIAQLFGPGLAQRLESIARADEGESAAWGFVGAPETARRGRRQFVFVNRRLVRDRAVLASFYRAVREEWRSDDFPALFLFLDLPPEEVDVNVHPQKAEVRFRDGGYVDAVGSRLRAALARARGEEPAPLRAPTNLAGAHGTLAWEGLGSPHSPHDEVRESTYEDQSKDFQFGENERQGQGSRPAATERGAFPFNEGFSASGGVVPGGRIAVAALAPFVRAPVPLSGRSGESRPFRLLGQYKGALVLLEGPDGLYVIDQHVAHERILYERLRREVESARPSVQRLLTPFLLELARSEALRLGELASALGAAGFELEELSGGTWALSGAPAPLGPDEARALVCAVASDREATPENLRRRLLDDFAASMACKAAVKMHHPMSAEKLEALVSELFRAENPYACPHGRPVVLSITDVDLERRFGRR